MEYDINLNTLILFGIAFLNAIAAIAAWQTKKDAAEIKVHSNSMKDEVVKAKEEVARLTGLFQGRAESERSAANHAKGMLAAGETGASTAPPNPTNGGPTEVEVVNTEKPVPVKITTGQIEKVAVAVKAKSKTRIKPKSKKRK